MQEVTSSEKPILLSIDFQNGHGFDTSENKKIADVLSFMVNRSSRLSAE